MKPFEKELEALIHTTARHIDKQNQNPMGEAYRIFALAFFVGLVLVVLWWAAIAGMERILP